MASNPPPKKALTISWDQFHRDARALAALLRSTGPFSSVVAITRGGLTPAAIVARELDLRCVETISIASYAAETVQGEARVVKEIAPAFIAAAEGSKVLVIDDLADTGETLRIVRKILPSAHVATIYVKPAGKPLVDTFVMEVSQETWIYFPWDLGLRFEPPLVDEG
jgi:xanthine phosphoribosyltransferase